MIRINQLKLPIGHTREELTKKAARTLKLSEKEIHKLRIIRQSVDARKKEQGIFFSYTVEVTADREEEVVKRAKNPAVILVEERTYQFPLASLKPKHPPVIIGCGPAGLFAGIMLARSGLAPVLLERGQDVDQRRKAVEEFWRGGPLKENSNVQFGEGGAGTFSDGKLNTLVKDPMLRNRKVLELLVEFGADPSILYRNKPHIGTDVLSAVVKNMRNEILRLGGQVRFDSCVTGFLIEGNHIRGAVVNGEETVECEEAVLAIGHSARDTLELLLRLGIPMRQKAFAVGLRIQHPQKMINLSQYGMEENEILGAAEYKVTHQCRDGRGIYSFCMCPGGYVVNASSEQERLAVNGMSNHARDGLNANSALIVTVTPEDFPDNTPLAGVAYQRALEEAAFVAGQGKIPIQLLGDFVNGTPSKGLGDVAPEFCGPYQMADLTRILPAYVTQAIAEGAKAFERMIHGFNRPDAILAGIESRTSSPVRIERGEDFQSPVLGLYPCGEGAGFAGGITSAAMDGLKVAEKIAEKYGQGQNLSGQN